MSEDNKRKILVVDDEPGIRIAVTMKLRMAGFDVSEATDGIEALEHFESNTADLAIVDVGMPRMDGYTLCQALHKAERTRAMPVIILTAQDMALPAEVEANIGLHRFMMKPFSPRDLLATVNEMLSSDEDDDQ